MTRSALLAALLLAAHAQAADAPKPSFADVRPIFAEHCVGCHGPKKQGGGLRLDRRADALKGGGDGPAIVPGKSADSLLFQLVSGADADRVMPPKSPRLPAEQLAKLRAWIDAGAEWPADAPTAEPRDWWSLKPLTRPAVPPVAAEGRARVRNPIDSFILAKLRAEKLTPSPEADRRTLIRRLAFDLTGLPPTPDEVAAFLKDPSPEYYEKLVDRLLASPAYGERWARHWLDVVHYGDTHGYDKDQPRPNAYPYRDYVIRAFNSDKPYGRFVEEQLAGDVLYPGTVDGATALGFIAAGPWDLIGHAEVPESKTDGKIARHLDRDDMVANALNTFSGLTAQCAQCHDHKFDPISQEEYYRLQAVFAAVDRADRPYYSDAAAAKKAEGLTRERETLAKRRDAIDAELRAKGGAKLADLERRIAEAGRPSVKRAEHGYHSASEAKSDAAKSVQVDLGRSSAISSVVLWGCHDDFAGIGAGFGFPVRYKVELSDDPEFGVSHVVVDRTATDSLNPGTAAVKFDAQGRKGRYLRVTATKLAPRQNDFIFALAELEAFDPAGKNLAAGAAVSSPDSIEAPVRWARKNLTDGHAPGKLAPADPAPLKAERQKFVETLLGSEAAKRSAELVAELARVDSELAKVPPTGRVFAGTVHHGAGNFRGTGPDGGKPRPIHLLRRGDVKTPAQEVRPGALAVFPELAKHFDLPLDHAEGDRRAALARWTSDPKNPLTFRVAVNRVWQYHFGRGLVATANDFGRMGQLPTHPELLDYLAAEFRDGGQSMKALHRLIVTSATYRQSSADIPANAAKDADNKFLWRMSRRKLEAEALRDAALTAAGKLDAKMYGPAFQDFKVEQPEHSPHYEYHLADPDDPKTFRRSVYRFLVRSKPQPFMAALDCADPSMQVEKRNESLSPLQALALMNNAFVLTMSKHLAARVERDADPIGTLYALTLSRPPSVVEREAMSKYAKDHGLANACRVVLNLNEFVFVD